MGSQVERLAGVFKRLNKERELYFYGDIDFIPSAEYKLEDAQEARESALFVESLQGKRSSKLLE